MWVRAGPLAEHWLVTVRCKTAAKKAHVGSRSESQAPLFAIDKRLISVAPDTTGRRSTEQQFVAFGERVQIGPSIDLPVCCKDGSLDAIADAQLGEDRLQVRLNRVLAQV